LSVEKQAKAIFPLIKTEIDSLPDYSPTVHFRVFLLELKKSQFRSFGLAWPAKIEGLFQVASGTVQSLLTLDLALHQLEGDGNAKILSNPELVVRAPGEAELFAGGELPIQQQNKYYSNVSWKNYGLTLRLKVTHCAGDKVRLDIFTEVSHLDASSQSERIPGIQANRMKTQVDARFGIPLFLSGLLQQGIREEVKGLPFLKNIPVLGALFGSSDYLNERSELVAILYPHSTPPEAPPEKQTQLIPRGLLPFPRNWISPQEERALKESENYPWNALN
jgi:pilus assembly protein CpaC